MTKTTKPGYMTTLILRSFNFWNKEPTEEPQAKKSTRSNAVLLLAGGGGDATKLQRVKIYSHWATIVEN